MTEFEKNDIVMTAEGEDFAVPGYYLNYLYSDKKYRVVRVFKNTVQVRLVEGQEAAPYPYSDASSGVPKSAIRKIDEPIKTFLEKFIEPGEEVIDPADPRVDYIWRAAAQAADDAGYCSVYDDITKRVGLPGRPKNFTVNIKVGSLDTRVTIKARSKEEAKRIAAAELSKGGTSVELVTE